MAQGTQTFPDDEHDKLTSSTGSENATPTTEANTDMTETMIPIEESYSLLTDDLSEESIPRIMERLALVVQFYKEKQQDDSEETEQVRRGVHTVLAGSPSREVSLALIRSDAFELFSSSLAAERERLFAVLGKIWDQLAAQPERLSAVLKKGWDQLTTTIKNHMPTIPPATVFVLLSKLRLLLTILQSHWLSSRQVDSIMIAQYPSLSFFMASCYYVALAAWFGELTLSLYHWCVADFGFERSVPVLILGALEGSLEIAVPYALGRGKRFATVLVLVLWVLLRMVREAMV